MSYDVINLVNIILHNFTIQVKYYFRDKAGGYGLQGIGGCLIEKIEGDYYTITGLPVYALTKHLNQIFSNN